MLQFNKSTTSHDAEALRVKNEVLYGQEMATQAVC